MNFGRRQINKKKNSKKILFIFTVIVFVALLYVKYKYDNFAEQTKITKTREITIEKGESFSSLSKKIEEFDNIFYKLYIRNNKPDFKLIEGKYELKEGENVIQTWESLQKPISSVQNVTILEGWNIYDIDRSLSHKGLISEGEYINYVTNKEKIVALSEFFPFLKNENLESLEGFLYPDTYRIDSSSFKINNFVIMQLEEFEKKVYDKLFAGKYDNKTIYDVINLASIVEKEEGRIKENQPVVAGILKKRLNAGWMIGADATVCYPYKLPTSECTPKKVAEYVYEKNEYNTRTMKGLPKTPIANPSVGTINATLNDEKTEYWYYLHNLSGKIYYAKTNEEHNYNRANFMNKK
ncbi:endolytic transglycosylase MltG [Candidatus Gracilibacteria bacterium]|nr:MAG: endolytic transglycosylase MltG [Candidatus Gracilibacteria bacterium]